jgi:adenylate cyclase
MAKEIERKFLVKNLDFVKYGVPHKIKQGYICTDNDRVVRVRINDKKAYLTIKNSAVGYSRDEFEYEIPVKDAEFMLAQMCKKPIICKTRFDLLHKGKKWEIDVFNNENEGLIIAEIELKNEEEEFIKPPFIDIEVTDDFRYYNSYINEHPFMLGKWANENKMNL